MSAAVHPTSSQHQQQQQTVGTSSRRRTTANPAKPEAEQPLPAEQPPPDEQPPRAEQPQASEPEYYYYYELEIPYWLLGIISAWLIVALIAGGLYYRLDAAHWAEMKAALGVEYVSRDDHANPPARSLRVPAAELVARLGPANARLYALLDRDANGLVSLAEFEPLVHHVRQDARHHASRQATEDTLYPAGCADKEGEDRTDGNSHCLRLRYRLSPPPVDMPYLRYDPHANSLATIANGSSVTGPAASAIGEVASALAAFAASGSVDTEASLDPVTIATAFLPRNPALLSRLRVGEPYTLMAAPPDGLQFFLTKQRRMNPGVYFEPQEVAMATVLRPLHRNLFIYPRLSSGMDSAAAVLRAESPTRMEFVIRIHPELQIAGAQAPRGVYLTPPGLEGRLLMDKAVGDSGGSRVRLLELGRPSGGSGSSSFYWHLESPHDIVEVGQIPLTELSISTVSAETAATEGHQWTTEISTTEALDLLRARMLPHMAARFHANLSAALAHAAADGEADKPVHLVLAFGGPQFPCDASCRALRDLGMTDPLVRLRLRHYYTNVWINLADSPALTELASLTAGTARPHPPITSYLLDPKSLRPLAEFTPDALRKALRPPDGLPNPLPPTPDAVASGEEPVPGRRKTNLLTGKPREPLEGEAADDHDESSELSPEVRHELERKALDAIRQQVSQAYMDFLRSGKA